MDQEQIQKFTERLKAQQREITDQLHESTNEDSMEKDKVQTKWENLGDKDEDNAVEVADFQDSISLERNLETSLGRIEKALDKVKAGIYGICEKCGKEIELARLEAYPEAELCMTCTKNQAVE